MLHVLCRSDVNKTQNNFNSVNCQHFILYVSTCKTSHLHWNSRYKLNRLYAQELACVTQLSEQKTVSSFDVHTDQIHVTVRHDQIQNS